MLGIECGEDRKRMILGLAVLLAGLACASDPAGAGEGPKLDPGVEAFRVVCLGSAPSFAAAEARARRRYGAKDFIGLGVGKSWMSPDKSLSIQIKIDKECATTTPNRPGDAVHAQFLQVVAKTARGMQEGETQTPFVAAIDGAKFAFAHDRRGGEAYVMVRLPN